MSAQQPESIGSSRKQLEIRTFILLTVVLAPVLAVALVGGLGFSIWIFQIFSGPPGPPLP
ncbi:MAG: periplasmic nitrate reductase, NapE protein [Arenicellales bacterium WSBS_2016_MAG_OTU3]